VTRRGWVALVVDCPCGRPWSPPVRLSVVWLRQLVACGLDDGTTLATTRCRHCGYVHRHTLRGILPK